MSHSGFFRVRCWLGEGLGQSGRQLLSTTRSLPPAPYHFRLLYASSTPPPLRLLQDGRLIAESEAFRGPQQAARRASVTCRSADTNGVIADFELLDGLVSSRHV